MDDRERRPRANTKVAELHERSGPDGFRDRQAELHRNTRRIRRDPQGAEQSEIAFQFVPVSAPAVLVDAPVEQRGIVPVSRPDADRDPRPEGQPREARRRVDDDRGVEARLPDPVQEVFERNRGPFGGIVPEQLVHGGMANEEFPGIVADEHRDAGSGPGSTESGEHR
jgi:hypothetical protein